MLAYRALDPYDDNRAQLKQLPEEVQGDLLKLAQDLSGQLDDLGDQAFALVAHIQGPEHSTTIRKFACVDPGNTALSVLYFLGNYAELPVAAVKVAAQNLLRSALDFDQTPPEKLVELAGDSDPYPETNCVFLLDKEAQSLSYRPELSSPPEKEVTASGKLSDQIHSTDDALTAFEAFSANERFLTGWEKRAFAKAVVQAVEKLEQPPRLPQVLEKYAQDTYAPDLGAIITVRQAVIYQSATTSDDFAKMAQCAQDYQALYEHREEMTPEAFAHRLEEIDSVSGFRILVPGPRGEAVFSTFGKTAQEDPVVWEQGPHLVRKSHLQNVAMKSRPELEATFGVAFADAFVKKPVEIFKSMPLPQKQILARFSSQAMVDSDVPK